VQAIVAAAQMIQTSEANIALAGGAESVSRGPYWMPDACWEARMGDSELIDPVIGTLTDPFESIPMGVTAEALAERRSIPRRRQDDFAIRSHQRAAHAQAHGLFDEQIVPVAIKRKRETVEFTRDEHIRSDVSSEALARLKPAFKRDGTVTAGNASGINDASAAVVVMSADRAAELGAPIRARILAYASCGVEPAMMGIGPVPAVRKVLQSAGRRLEEVDVIELNEAFAAQALAVIDDLSLDEAKVIPNGGAIALGHPGAATGTAITTKLVAHMERRDLELGLVTLCIGGGQGIALLLDRQ
jgi:acetyl-CoA C-acetyltransferase